MKKNTILVLGVLLCCFSILPAAVLAGVEWETVKSFNVGATPLDVASSDDGRWHFVLAEGGKILIYTGEGALYDTIQASADVDRIKAVGTGMKNTLFASSSSSKTVHEISLTFPVTINTEGAPFKGEENAPVTVTVFSDFQCPYCSRLDPLFQQLLVKYPGKVKIVYKHFPLRSHKMAEPAARASVAAQNQGKFWEYHDLIFANYRALSDEKLIEYAEKLELEIERFKLDMGSPATRQKVMTDFQDGRNALVRGTPSLYVNGIKIEQGDSIEEIISKELQKAEKGS